MTLQQILTALGIPEQPQTFEAYVAAWEQVADAAKRLKDLEMDMRKAIATSTFQNPKEGVNTHAMVDGRKLKLTHKYTRSVDEASIARARAEYELVNDRPVPFDNLLKVKYDLATTEYKKLELGSAAYLAVSHMVTVKPAAPALELK